MEHISTTEYAPYYAAYIQQAGNDIEAELEKQLHELSAFIRDIPEEKNNFAYAPGKWTTKEVIGHIIDVERIMACRALRIARNDGTPLPGFDQDNYVTHARHAERTLDSLSEEFKLLRQGNIFLFKTFNEEELFRIGSANGYPISVRALLHVITGHLKHHVHILEERYLR